MNHWPFIIAAYAVTLGATFALLILSWRQMRNAEAKADALKRS